MAIDFGDAQSTRWYDAADHADFTMDESAGYTVAAWAKWDTNRLSGSGAQYLVSSGAYLAGETYNLIIYEDSAGANNDIEFAIDGGGGNVPAVTTGGLFTDDGAWTLIAGGHDSANGTVRGIKLGASSILDSDTQAGTTGDVDPTGGVRIGHRLTGGDRYVEGIMGGVFICNSHYMSDAEMIAIAQGISPLVVLGPHLTFFWEMRDVGDGVDLIGGHALTENGTGQTQVEHVPQSIGWPVAVTRDAGVAPPSGLPPGMLVRHGAVGGIQLDGGMLR
jgi:hypothetical protein